VIDIPSLSSRHIPSTHVRNRPDVVPAFGTRPDRRTSHLHVRSPRAVVEVADTVEAAAMLAGRDRAAATLSYDPNIGQAVKGSLSRAHRRWFETMIGCSDIVVLSEDELASLRPGERYVDAVRWLMTRGPAIITVTGGAAGVVGYVKGGSVLIGRDRAVDVVDAHAAGGALTAGLLYALDERGLLGAGAYEALQGIGLDEVGDLFRDANRYGASTFSPLEPGHQPCDIVLGP